MKLIATETQLACASINVLECRMSSPLLQSYVVPVCLYRQEDKEANLLKAVGTAFFVGKMGFYLTARHVLEQAFAQAKSEGLEVGLNIKGPNLENKVEKIRMHEHAPKPFDISVGLGNYIPKTPLTVARYDTAVWQEIATMGYPVSSHVMEGGALWINMRGHRGYVQRPTIPRDIHLGTHPNGFELSFLLSPGMSGCPIFTSPDERLIGVGVSSFKSELVEEEFTEVQDGNHKYTEKRVRVEQYGFAHDIQGLLDWKAGLFGGMTFEDIAKI